MTNQFTLPDDVMIRILSPFQARNLRELRWVSPGWRDVIESIPFISEQHIRGDNRLDVFFFGNRLPREASDDSTASFLLIAADDNGPNINNVLLAFLPVRRVALLSTSHGLVCCRSADPGPVRVFICNSLCHDFIEIDWPHEGEDCMVSIVFDPVRDPIINGIRFKVVTATDVMLDPNTLQQCVLFSVYSSETKHWREVIHPCLTEDNLIRTTGVEVGGKLYWLTDAFTVIYSDPTNERSRVIQLLIPTGDLPCIPEVVLGESGGLLVYTTVTTHGFSVWELRDVTANEENIWHLRYTIPMDVLVGQSTVDGVNNLPFYVGYHAARHNVPNRHNRAFVAPLAYKDDTLILRIYRSVYALYTATNILRRFYDMEDVAIARINQTPVVLSYVLSLMPLNNIV